MAAERTSVTELATAAGMILGPHHDDLALLEALEIPGIDDSVWRPSLEPAAESWHQFHPILRAALANGAAFREAVLKGRDPAGIEWRGAKQTMWVSDTPADLTVNETIHVSAKYDSKCFLNRAPAALFHDLLAGTTKKKRPDWYGVVASDAYGAFYRVVLDTLQEQGAPLSGFPATPTDLTKAQRLEVKYLMKLWPTGMPPAVASAYRDLASAVSLASARAWREALASATETVKISMIAQMLRISGTTYWLLGHAGGKPVQHQVVGTHKLREVYRLKTFAVTDRPDAGQPRVDWEATLLPKKDAPAWATPRVLNGICEVRWSHQKLQGNPECKVQLKTPVADLPGYLPL